MKHPRGVGGYIGEIYRTVCNVHIDLKVHQFPEHFNKVNLFRFDFLVNNIIYHNRVEVDTWQPVSC
jgi:hypothetical protein